MLSSLHNYDLRSRSKNGTSKDLADNTSISSRKRVYRRAPRVPLSYTNIGPCKEKTSRKCALAALSSLNEKGQAEQGPKYQLVEALGCVEFRTSGLYHCNFIAKPRKKGIEAENKLCFAEVQREFKEVAGVGWRTLYTCRFACILGPIGSETGLNGCTFCVQFPNYIQHPEDGFKKIVFTQPCAVEIS